MLAIIGKGIAAGAAYGLWKYYNKRTKAKDQNWKDQLSFSKKKFVKTLLIGAMIGGVAAYFGISVELAFGNEMLYFGSVVVVEEAIKTARRFLKHRGIL